MPMRDLHVTRSSRGEHALAWSGGSRVLLSFSLGLGLDSASRVPVSSNLPPTSTTHTVACTVRQYAMLCSSVDTWVASVLGSTLASHVPVSSNLPPTSTTHTVACTAMLCSSVDTRIPVAGCCY